VFTEALTCFTALTKQPLLTKKALCLQYYSTFHFYRYWVVVINTKNDLQKDIDILIRCNRFLSKYAIYHKQFFCLFLAVKRVENLRFVLCSITASLNKICLRRRLSSSFFFDPSFQNHTKTSRIFVSVFILETYTEY
jgi:hypothetical protein